MVEGWNGFFGPKGIPKPVMEKLSIVFEKAVNQPSVQKMIRQTGCAPFYMNATELKDFLKKETEKYRKVAEQGGMIIKY